MVIRRKAKMGIFKPKPTKQTKITYLDDDPTHTQTKTFLPSIDINVCLTSVSETVVKRYKKDKFTLYVEK